MGTPLKDSLAYGTFLDTYNRLTSPSPETPRDSAVVVCDILVEHGKMKLADLIDTTHINTTVLFPTLEKLQKLDAIDVTGTGFDQEVEITPKGLNLIGLFKS
ncbi:MAG TPA: hypothetical protein VE974_28545 [Thermoanaerobaculia bacterium]|nr:hypothetical protein [Thermoanaerobaculia bacterium]